MIAFAATATPSTNCHELFANAFAATSCSCKPTTKNSTAFATKTSVFQKPVICLRLAGVTTRGAMRLAYTPAVTTASTPES